MADFEFAPTFLRQLVQMEPSLSATERQTLDDLLGGLATNPSHKHRFVSHYGCEGPEFLFRQDPFLLGYSVNPGSGTIIFMSLFRRAW